MQSRRLPLRLPLSPIPPDLRIRNLARSFLLRRPLSLKALDLYSSLLRYRSFGIDVPDIDRLGVDGMRFGFGVFG